MTMVVDELRGMKWNRGVCWRPLASGANEGRWYACEGIGGGPVEVMGCTWFLVIYLLWITEILKE